MPHGLHAMTRTRIRGLKGFRLEIARFRSYIRAGFADSFLGDATQIVRHSMGADIENQAAFTENDTGTMIKNNILGYADAA